MRYKNPAFYAILMPKVDKYVIKSHLYSKTRSGDGECYVSKR